jgi:hypothetical protein
MTADATKVRDQSFALVYAALSALTGPPKIFWEGKVLPTSAQPTSTDEWVQVSLRHVVGRQASLAGANGARRWNRTGFITVQCFAPLAAGGVQAATQLASVVRDALQGQQTEDCVWFRNARINEVGPDRDWFQVNAIIDFDYDETR